jgi:hypothetical protein
MPDTEAPPPPGSITARARRAACERRDDMRTPATWRDERWSERAHAAARELADLLAVARERVHLAADHTRAYGEWVWPQMTATDTTGHLHRFVASYNDPERLLALGSCPACGGEVPLTWVRTLADYGDLLDGTALEPGTFDPVPEFRGDPGHRAHCPHAHLH